ncbi:RNA polymerase sigma factor [Dokdonella fugitiva]|uniref:RNA polymerase sigma factor n=1 Tax=Dokdonella fugitiva TaxID=328517 RepID=A0A4R2IEL0_9GAMM|nr:sigma-70 family RNA polymerase sigma factor [Dokdonella fugitiva]TCO41095.1 RNA polymerase sigma-70 factor (ECF subfamily) [Dokdonella fugitiva]
MADSAAEARVDRALVTRVLLDDDRRAFEQLVRRHQGMVRAQLRRLLRGDETAADDIAQEVFLLAWRKLDQFRGEASFRTWLYRIAWTCFLQAQRRNPAPADDADEVEPPTAPAQPVDLQLDFELALRRLSDGEQAVLLHCVQLGLSHEEAAFVLAMPLGTVKTHATRGKAKLKSWLSAWRAGAAQEDPA